MNSHARSCRLSVDKVLLSVVLPVYNEAEVLPALLKRLIESLAACDADYEIIFVNDGSSDGSPQILDELAAQDASLRIIHLVRNFGHQAAVQAGLAHARGDAVVLMDSDMQDAPEAIPRFVEEWRDGYDVVYAIRTHRKENALKRCLFATFHRLLAAMASVRIPVDAGIFGLIDGRAAREINALAERDRYFPGLRSWVGFRQIGVEVERNARYDDRPRVSLLGLFRLAKTAIFSFSSFPLAIFYAIACLAAVVFVALAGYSIYCKLFTDLAIPGWTSHILTGSFFGALNALGICILGEYMVRIYDQVRGRPLYLVDRTVNMESDPAGSDWTDETVDLELLEQLAQLLDLEAKPPPSAPSPATSRGTSQPVIVPIRENCSQLDESLQASPESGPSD